MADRHGNADRNAEIHALSGQMLDASVRNDPFLASFVGIPEAASLVPDLTDDGRSALRSRLTDLASRAATVDPAGLSDQDQITLEMLAWQAENIVAALDARKPEYSVTPINTRSAATAIITLVPKTPISGPDEAGAYLQRVSLLAGMLDAASQWLDRGVLSERTPVHHLVRGAIRQLDDFLASGGPREAIAGIVPVNSWPGEPDWRDRLARLVTDELTPALVRYRDHLAQRVLPACHVPSRNAACAGSLEATEPTAPPLPSTRRPR